jgi:hypothetical protein
MNDINLAPGTVLLLKDGIFMVNKKTGGVTISLKDLEKGTDINKNTQKVKDMFIREVGKDEALRLVEKCKALTLGTTWQLKSDEKLYTITTMPTDEHPIKVLLTEVKTDKTILKEFYDLLEDAIYQADLNALNAQPKGQPARIELLDKSKHLGTDYGDYFIADKSKKRYDGEAYEKIKATGKLTIL